MLSKTYYSDDGRAVTAEACFTTGSFEQCQKNGQKNSHHAANAFCSFCLDFCDHYFCTHEDLVTVTDSGLSQMFGERTRRKFDTAGAVGCSYAHRACQKMHDPNFSVIGKTIL